MRSDSGMLETIIKDDIEKNGAMRLDVFMALALGHPEYGYYTARDPLGAAGDFITAPEISQLFGEIIGIWCVRQWARLGSPASCSLVELGPGRGTLMSDLLRGTKHVPGFHDSLSLHLVETSPVLRQKQENSLSDYTVQWHDDLAGLDDEKPFILVANEFFDALPIRQFKYTDGGWTEYFVAIGADGNLAMQWQKTNVTPGKDGIKPQSGDISEISEIQNDYAMQISGKLARQGGGALIIDYGHAVSAYGDTLQALYNHAPCPVLSHIGEADITSHVDFERLGSFFAEHENKGAFQSEFLHRNGISLRLQLLLENNPDKADALQSGYERLTGAGQMGELFKALEIFNPAP